MTDPMKIAADHLAETVRDYLEEMEHLADPCLRKALDEYNAIARAASPSTPAVAEASLESPILVEVFTVTDDLGPICGKCGRQMIRGNRYTEIGCAECSKKHYASLDSKASPATTSPASDRDVSSADSDGVVHDAPTPAADAEETLSEIKRILSPVMSWSAATKLAKIANLVIAPSPTPSTVAPASTAGKEERLADLWCCKNCQEYSALLRRDCPNCGSNTLEPELQAKVAELEERIRSYEEGAKVVGLKLTTAERALDARATREGELVKAVRRTLDYISNFRGGTLNDYHSGMQHIESTLKLTAALSRTAPATATLQDGLRDAIRTHKAAWREALNIVINVAADDDKANRTENTQYWKEERDAFDAMCKLLDSTPTKCTCIPTLTLGSDLCDFCLSKLGSTTATDDSTPAATATAKDGGVE